MELKSYKELVKKYKPKEHKLKNAFVAFLVGGFIGFLAEFIIRILMISFAFSQTKASIICAIVIIFLGSLFTAIGFLDDWFVKFKCGLILPTTGFAHSVTSAALDYKKDGLITGLGSNFFKLAGSVLLYGIISAFFAVLLQVIIYG